jgi:hypothetical protein
MYFMLATKPEGDCMARRMTFRKGLRDAGTGFLLFVTVVIMLAIVYKASEVCGVLPLLFEDRCLGQEAQNR